jgi:hypothetical protein
LQSTAASLVVDIKTVFMLNNTRIFAAPGFNYILSVPGGGGANNEATDSFNALSDLTNFTFPSGGWQTGVKIGICGNAAGRSLVNGGLTVASDASPFSYAGAPQKLGYPTNMLNGLYRRLTCWNSRLSDGSLQGFTAP